jgi:hypothetical protein
MEKGAEAPSTWLLDRTEVLGQHVPDMLVPDRVPVLRGHAQLLEQPFDLCHLVVALDLTVDVPDLFTGLGHLVDMGCQGFDGLVGLCGHGTVPFV